MPAGLTLAIALLAEVAGAAPDAAAAPSQPPPTIAETRPQAAERCSSAMPTPESGEIVVCVQRPEGYRLNPDVMETKRLLRRGRPKPPETMKDNSCASVGPMGCAGMGGAGIDLVGAAIVLGTMATKAVRGENVGRMFVTDPQPSEYELYVEAKRIREAKEAEAKAKEKAEAAEAPRQE